MASEAFPFYITAVSQKVLPIYPLIAIGDLHKLFNRLVDEPSEERSYAVSEDYDISFAMRALRLGHRILEQTTVATQLRCQGNSNIDRFETCSWRRFSRHDRTTTGVAWYLEGVSFAVLYHVCAGLPSANERTVLLEACRLLAMYVLLLFNSLFTDGMLEVASLRSGIGRSYLESW